MSKRPVKNITASVRARLLALSIERKIDFQLILNQYGIERLLYRLSQSNHGKKFVLKGAMLFAVWTDRPTRPTRDLDLSGSGDSSAAAIECAFREVFAIKVEPDGLEFDLSTIRVHDIREDQEYDGKRVEFTALLATTRIPMQVDIGFGDAITPLPTETNFPSLLDDMIAPVVRAYPKETVVAEKLEAMVQLGMDNSRMKDFYDLWVLATKFEFDGQVLAAAIGATFERRATKVPNGEPFALTAAFSENADKAKQWSAFVRRGTFEKSKMTLPEIVSVIRPFLIPVLQATHDKTNFCRRWCPAGWRERG